MCYLSPFPVFCNLTQEIRKEQTGQDTTTLAVLQEEESRGMESWIMEIAKMPAEK